ncbi:MAG: hypothetical protein IKQ84_09620 [Spirochaetaceae bacterium]|nr:hypothetical protein [Spirochaetaceae bacterium]
MSVIDRNKDNSKFGIRTSIEHEKFKAFKEECFNFAKEHFQGKYFLNENRNVLIKVSRTGLNEWFSKTKTYEQSESIKYLDAIIKSADYSHSAKNKHPKRGDENSTFDYYDYIINIDGKDYAVVLTVKNVQGQGGIYYHHFLDDIKIEPTSSMIQP